MKKLLTFFLVIAINSGLYSQTTCNVKIIYSMNKSLPPSYTFKTDPVIEGARYIWTFGNAGVAEVASPTFTFKTTDSYQINVKVVGSDGKICYGELKDKFEGSSLPGITTSQVLSAKGKVKDLSSTAGCNFVISLDNGIVIVPLESAVNFVYKNGQYVEIAYELLKEKPSGCSAGVSAKIHKIIEVPQVTSCKATIIISKNNTSPQSYNFKTDINPEGAVYKWNFGDGGVSEKAAPSYTFKKTGKYLVSLKVTDKTGKICVGEISETFEGETTFEVPNPVVYTKGKVKNLSSTAGCNFVISLDNGIVIVPLESAVNFVYKDGQSVELAYELLKEKPSGCSAGISAKIHKIYEINVPEVCTIPISFNIVPTNTNTFTYNFKTSVQPEGSKFNWYFGDGSLSDAVSPTYTFKNAGTYTVNLKVVDKNNKVCYGETKIQVGNSSILPLAGKGKVKKLAVSGCDLVIMLENGTILIPARNNSNLELKEGQYYEITYEKLAEKITTCKEGSDIKILSIKEIPQTLECKANFTASNEMWSNPAMIKKFVFKNTSAGEIKECKWSFGDNKTSTELNPTHEYGEFGEYKVCLSITTTNGCHSEYCASVKVISNVVSACKFDIIAKPKEASQNSFVFYTASTVEIKTWKWTFGDGKTSELKNPEHIYEKEGNYEVTCTVTTANCNETKSIKLTVAPAQLASCKGSLSILLTDPTENKCNGIAVIKLLENNFEPTNVKYLWNDGKTGGTRDNLCPDKTYTVQAIIEGVCQKTTSFTMLSKPVWKASSINGANNFTVVSPIEGVEYEWNFGNGVVIKGAQVTYNFDKDGIYDVNLKAISGTNISESSQQVVVMKSLTGTSIINKNDLKIYPSPVKNELKIDLGSQISSRLQIEIIDMSGKKIAKHETNNLGYEKTINVSDLRTGVYFIRVTSGKILITDQKFIKIE